MNLFKSHFWYTKNQRNGIFILVLFILLLQVSIYTGVFSSDKITDINQSELLDFQSQIDSLKAIEIENRRSKTYPFNPNYITDYKGEQLGMSTKEIDRLIYLDTPINLSTQKKNFKQ
jgi:ABC-type microcin C transport system permease subunit YejE